MKNHILNINYNLKNQISLRRFIFFFCLFVISIFANSCEILNSTKNDLNNDQVFNENLIVYRNRGKELFLFDINTYEISKKITIPVSESIQIHGIIQSTNNDYLICCGALAEPPYTNYIISYDILNNSIKSKYKTELDSVGAPRMIAAQRPEDSGLFYLYSHNVGLYAIDFIDKTLEMISPEKGLPKTFYHSNTGEDEWIVINKYYPGYDKSYTELQFYSTVSGLNNIDYILNDNDKDSLDVVDMVFSSNNEFLYISYLLSQRRAVYESAFFGCYNLKTKEFETTNIKLPWSSNPYYISYSPILEECYMVGEQDKLYVIDVSDKNYKLKNIIELTGKTYGPSRIQIHPDDNIAFISCYYSNLIFVVDLDQKKIKTKIDIENPYLMLYLGN